MNTCHFCGGELTLLGRLGAVEWSRCRYCGLTQHSEHETTTESEK